MKFRIKMTLCMLGLLSVLFGVGGSLLISISFHASLIRERESVYNSYQMVRGALQIVNRASGLSDNSDLSHTLDQLSEQSAGAWTSLRLRTGAGPVYTYGPQPAGSDTPGPGRCTIRLMPGHALILTGSLEADGALLYLDLARDLSPLFETRRTQEQTYLWVFLLLSGLCAVLSYSVSHILTTPLARLSGASRSIATGQLSSRAEIHTQDEIGLVALDFNAMADALEENISALKDSVTRQERFLGSFAHEVKTPMTSIIGYADLLRGQTLGPDDALEAANYIVSEGKRLESLSEKLLNLMVLSHTEIPLAPVRPAALIGGLAARLAPLYQRQGITLRWDCGDGACLLEADLIKSLLFNLCDNARKALEGRTGSILLRSEMLPGGCVIQVRDTGRGIPPEALAHLTEAFYRVDKSRARRQGGVGLGLSLCREIVALHHGAIRFESQVGAGTTVTVELKGGAV